MDSFNKVISFVLGLVVVIVFLAIVSGKIDIRKKISGIGSTNKSTSTGFSLFGARPTPTLTPTPTPKTTTASGTGSTYNQYNGKTPKTIPATGSPTILLPLLFSALAGGSYLRKKS